MPNQLHRIPLANTTQTITTTTDRNSNTTTHRQGMAGPMFAVSAAGITRKSSLNIDASESPTSASASAPATTPATPRHPRTPIFKKPLLRPIAINKSTPDSKSTSSTPTSAHQPHPQQQQQQPRPRPRSPSIPFRRPSLPNPLLRRPTSPHHHYNSFRSEPTSLDAPGSKASPATKQERELLIIAHGLQGTPEDFNFVLDSFRNSKACTSGQLIIHASRVNTDRTHDGVAAGGMRLANDVQEAVDKCKSERKHVDILSMIGFSLGGLYVRYAAAVLYDGHEKGTLAGGLKGGSIILVASPHLGVRRFGVYRFVPEVAKGGVKVFGDTIREMMLMDDACMMERMSKDDEDNVESDFEDGVVAKDDSNHNDNDEENVDANVGTSERRGKKLSFMSSLKAFELRVLYANVRNDFMVSFGTAALEPRISAVSGNEMENVMRGAATTCSVDESHDDKGCKVCFRYWIDGDENGIAFGDNSERQLTMVNASTRSNHGLGLLMDDGRREVLMAQRLRSLGWWVVGVDFPLALPIAHNRIVAMSRNFIHAWINAPGQRAVHHLVDTACSRFEQHRSLFNRTDRDGQPIGTDGELSIK